MQWQQPLRARLSLCHLQQEPETHPFLLLLIGLPHDIVGSPDVVGQVVCHALAEIWLGSGIREWDGLTGADQSCIKRPAYHQCFRLMCSYCDTQLHMFLSPAAATAVVMLCTRLPLVIAASQVQTLQLVNRWHCSCSRQNKGFGAEYTAKD